MLVLWGEMGKVSIKQRRLLGGWDCPGHEISPEILCILPLSEAVFGVEHSAPVITQVIPFSLFRILAEY